MLNKYSDEAKEKYGNTKEYSESKKLTDGYTKEDWDKIQNEADDIYSKFIENMDKAPNDKVVLEIVMLWQQHISKYYYNCTNEILSGLGQLYVNDERFTENIDKSKTGLAQFISSAIKAYCSAESE